MEQIRIEKLISGLRHGSPCLDPRIRAGVISYARANGFRRSAGAPMWRYAAILSAFAIFGAAGTVFAAQRANPGQTLYGVKRASETAYVKIQPNHRARVEANEMLIKRRLSEAQAFMEKPLAFPKAEIDFEAELAVDASLAAAMESESEAWINAQEKAFTRYVNDMR